jgi:hypothetical protein
MDTESYRACLIYDHMTSQRVSRDVGGLEKYPNVGLHVEVKDGRMVARLIGPAEQVATMVRSYRELHADSMDQDCACTECNCASQAWGGGLCRECAAGVHNL